MEIVSCPYFLSGDLHGWTKVPEPDHFLWRDCRLLPRILSAATWHTLVKKGV
jgi:hypothetical protein